MNRRRFLIALAILIPLALFGAAKWATRWRPVAIASIYGLHYVGETSRRYLIVGGNERNFLFDLKTGANRELSHQGLASNGALWSFDRDQGQFQLSQANGAALALALPDELVTGDSSKFPLGSGMPVRIRVTASQNRVEAHFSNRYCRWNLSSRRLERNVLLDFQNYGDTALSRDGAWIVQAGYEDIAFVSTRSGRVGRRVALRFNVFESMMISPYGSFALYDQGAGNSSSWRWRVVDTGTGRVKWSFDLDEPRDFAVFSPDEKWLALPLTSRHIWQIRELSSGAILRTLPLVPGAHSGAFSPDGATLYSVAQGVLYRQRAR